MNIPINNFPIILENKDFQTIMIKVLFPFQEKTGDLAKIQLLPNLLQFMNQTYPTEEEYQKEKKKLYILGCGCTKIVIGTSGCLSFQLTIPHPSVLGENLLKEQILFFSNMIYKPLLENQCFSSFELEREKKNLKISIDSSFKDMKSYQNIRIRELIDDEGILSMDIVRHQDLIDKVTPKNLYAYYHSIITNNQPIIYIMGDVSQYGLKEICQKCLFLRSPRLTSFPAHLYYYLKPRRSVLYEEEQSDFKDSSLSFVYKINNYSKDDTIFLQTVRDLLSSLSSRLLNQKLRDEHDLVYSSNVTIYPHFGAFEITAYIQADNKNIVQEKLLEVMNQFQDESIIEPLLDNIKERKRLNLMRKLDDKYLLFEDFIFSDLGIDITLEESYQQLISIHAADIGNFVNRFVLDTIYFLKEESHE